MAAFLGVNGYYSIYKKEGFLATIIFLLNYPSVL